MGTPGDVIHLHTHTEYSCFDGCGHQEDYIQKAKDMGSPAIGITEHGSMRGVYKQHENCQNIENIRPIYGIEFYLADDMELKGLSEEEKEQAIHGLKGWPEKKEALYQMEVKLGRRARFHLTAIAKNEVGLKNLYKLSSIGWIKGFYKRPRIDLNVLEQHREGIILLSGCTSGALNDKINKGDVKGAIELAERFKGWFGEDFYLEIMPHGLPDQVTANKALVMMSKGLGIPLVATQDAHWINKDDREAQEALLCIQTNDVMANPERFKFTTDTFWLAARTEMEELFRIHHPTIAPEHIKAALDNTLVIGDKAQAKLEIDRKKALLPQIQIPAEYAGDEFLYLRDLCMGGWDTRNMRRRAEYISPKLGKSADEIYRTYITRLKYELEMIRKMKAVRYFLIIWDLYNWARSQGIQVGAGRGSVGGSLAAYLLYITEVDPLEHGLIFERFLKVDRIDMPDIDCDFEVRRREDVINYLRGKYGNDYTAMIATVSTLKGKKALRDIGRILQIPKHEVDEVADSIIERSSGDERASQCLEDSFKEFKVCRDFHAKYPKVLQLAKRLEGQALGLGIHAAGVVVSPIPLIDVIPLETRESDRRVGNERKQETVIVTALDMIGTEGYGLVKIDVLGLRNLDVIKDCLGAIKERTGEQIDLNWIDMNDAPTLANFTAHKFKGIFQYDTAGADKVMEGVEFTSFDDVVAMIALNRPGTARSGLATEYIKRKQNPKARIPVHPVVDNICSDTLGVIVYQEHVLKMFVEVAGFSPATADSLRKKIAKKWGDETIGKERDNFINGALSRGFDRALAERLIDQITFFGSYGFNKSHSVEYGYISYWEMWLKTHYPLEFMWALLQNEPQDEIPGLVKEARSLGIEVRSPDVNKAGVNWQLDGDAIIASMSDLKGVGPGAIAAVEMGRAVGPYKTFVDFLRRTERRKVNRKVVEVLLKAGALSGLVVNQKWLLEHLEEVWNIVGKGNLTEVARRMVASASEPDWTKDEAQEIASQVNPTAFGKHPIEPHSDFLFNVLKTNWTSMNDEQLYDLGNAFVYGQIIEIKYNQVGDFNTGKEPDEDEKRRMKWGARYANVNVEDLSSKQNRVKVDHDIFDTYRHIVDKGRGTLVGIHASTSKKYKNIRAHYLVDLMELKQKLEQVGIDVAAGRLAVPDENAWVKRLEETLTPFERVLVGGIHHPVASHNRKDLNVIGARTRNGGTITVCGLVTHVNTKLDKKMNWMGFFGLQGFKGYLDCLCFASSWGDFEDLIKPGQVIRVTLKKDKTSYILADREPDPVVVLT